MNFSTYLVILSLNRFLFDTRIKKITFSINKNPVNGIFEYLTKPILFIEYEYDLFKLLNCSNHLERVIIFNNRTYLMYQYSPSFF